MVKKISLGQITAPVTLTLNLMSTIFRRNCSKQGMHCKVYTNKDESLASLSFDTM